WLHWVLNFILTVILSFPYLLFEIALIPVTLSVLGKAFGPIPSSGPLSIVATAIFARLVEQVQLDAPEEIDFLVTWLGTSKVQY
ncbi:ABC transporter permease, partial [Enterococcus faecalis]|nr:ABC transporter permease [Enterococcus faecalis]